MRTAVAASGSEVIRIGSTEAGLQLLRDEEPGKEPKSLSPP